MSDVYCKCETPPIIGKLVFVNGASNVKFYVPKAAVERYQTADGWSAYANSIMADPNDN
jgi:hypothetical protein